MENPYEGQNYRPYTPPPVYEPESAPNSSVYQGNATFATLSLVMGILSLCPKENTDVPEMQRRVWLSA